MPELKPQESFQFKSPEEELDFLRAEIARRERELALSKEAHEERANVVWKEIEKYKEQPMEKVLAPEYAIPQKEAEGIALDLSPEEHDEKMGELLGILQHKGVKNTLSIVEKMKDPHIEDDFHRILIEYIREGFPVSGLKEKGPLWKSLHMTLYEVALPDKGGEEGQKKTLKEFLSAMEQFYAGMLSVSEKSDRGHAHFTIEIALPDKSDEVVFYVAVPNHKRDLFEKHLLSIFTNARVHEQKNDYNIFIEGGVSTGSYAKFSNNAIFPLRMYESFDYDPLNVVLNAFSKIEKIGGGAAIQLVISPKGGTIYLLKFKEALRKIKSGAKVKDAIKGADIGGEFLEALGHFFSPSEKKEGKEKAPPDPLVVQNIEQKTGSPIESANIRLVASATTLERAQDILSDIESAFNQLENTHGNKLSFVRVKDRNLFSFLKDFSFREYAEDYALPLNIKELTTILHFPLGETIAAPQLRESKAGTAPASVDAPQEGTLLGVNRFRNMETKIYLTKEDRLRHFYIIGQTGTGKTTLLKNMIIQDIRDGEGVCMIDPHGSDIVDVLGAIPPERFDDVVYFDPAYTSRVMGLNMLEYDPDHPEQKTFVVNELFSIFQKLYGAVPESMGPIFEQYFRNAAMLVIEDPLTGSTLLDISRVLAEEPFRNLKLSRAKNPVVKQFWTEIATKAGGEQSLANIVPYITSKFDVFMANDIMRPIIAQEKSSLNFRRIMDERKILLVNLSKGKLGDINANLLGLILVGKILMAALSRVDSMGKELPPFYLYIDEFQNVTTDSISIILSEARKYKLSLTAAHQFIAQLDEKTKNAVFGNVGSMAAFRIGPEDAEFLEKQFAPVFTARDLLNIDNRNAYVKLLMRGRPAKPFNIEILPPKNGDPAVAVKLKELSYQKYGEDRNTVEEYVQKKYLST